MKYTILWRNAGASSTGVAALVLTAAIFIVGPAAAHDDGYWAEHRIVDFIERHASRTRPSAAERFP